MGICSGEHLGSEAHDALESQETSVGTLVLSHGPERMERGHPWGCPRKAFRALLRVYNSFESFVRLIYPKNVLTHLSSITD